MLEFINDHIISLITPIMLLGAGVYFLFKLKFFFVRYPLKTLKEMTSRRKVGGISPFRAVTLALAGTLGVGNIAGVASSIAIGGYGSVFWMWISALVAMVLKYAEIVLAIRHRRYDGSSGEYRGGAAYYIKDHFLASGKRRLGVCLSLIFAILCAVNALTMGCMIQSNAISTSLEGVFDLPAWISGAAVALLVLAVIVGNAERISGVSEKVIPPITLGYILISIAAIAAADGSVGDAFALIFEDLHSPKSAAGGVIGFLISRALRAGVMRGLMSNEAGCGTAPTAHATADTDSPSRQGLWGLFEVFVDTVLLCTLTALVIILAGDGVTAYASDPMMMAIKSYSVLLGAWSEYFMCAAVFLFAFATLICWAHYGRESLTFITRGAILQRVFVGAFALFIFVGAIMLPEGAWLAADLALGIMTVINTVVLVLMSGEVGEETNKLFPRQSRRGKLGSDKRNR